MRASFKKLHSDEEKLHSDDKKGFFELLKNNGGAVRDDARVREQKRTRSRQSL